MVAVTVKKMRSDIEFTRGSNTLRSNAKVKKKIENYLYFIVKVFIPSIY
jgi:hypothetical protein